MGAITKPIVTIFATYGSGSRTIAPKIAQALGVPYLGNRFSSEELESAKEHVADSETFLSRFLSSFGLATESDPTASARAQSDQNEALENSKVVTDAVTDGGVVLGRNATAILRTYPGALHVKLDGNPRDRISRAAVESCIDIEKAAKRQAYEDRLRAEMSIRLYNWDPRDDHQFDLVINTTNLSGQTVVDIVVAAQRAKLAALADGVPGEN